MYAAQKNVNSKEYLLNFLDRSLKTTSSKFIKTRTVAERFFHADKQNEERTDMHDDAESPFSQLFVRLQRSMKFTEEFSEIDQTKL